ncbi:MAG: zinc transporter ZupT [Rikenellaceae bacterium]|nr:zinc transporter ZupT [Rikenellaceae bacterium]
MSDQILYALLLTTFAGLSTGIGSAIALFTHHTNRKFLSFSLGLSAGVMIYVSFVELLYEARIDLSALLGEKQGNLVTAAAFFGGMLLAGLIDKLVPEVENPHEMRSVESMDGVQSVSREHHQRRRLARMGLMTALAVTIHNFPEGIATFVAATEAPSIGIAIAVAIAIHNIPEGIAVFVPIYFATGNKRKAFWYSFLSGISEPVGAVAGYLILMPFMTPEVMGCVFAAVAGIMVYISLDELLPAAQEYGEHHLSIYGLVTGMVVMAASLILLM